MLVTSTNEHSHPNTILSYTTSNSNHLCSHFFLLIYLTLFRYPYLCYKINFDSFWTKSNIYVSNTNSTLNPNSNLLLTSYCFYTINLSQLTSLNFKCRLGGSQECIHLTMCWIVQEKATKLWCSGINVAPWCYLYLI